jgi:hypothetical protein
MQTDLNPQNSIFRSVPASQLLKRNPQVKNVSFLLSFWSISYFGCVVRSQPRNFFFLKPSFKFYCSVRAKKPNPPKTPKPQNPKTPKPQNLYSQTPKPQTPKPLTFHKKFFLANVTDEIIIEVLQLKMNLFNAFSLVYP